jgi:hypothetical protein
MFEKLLQSLVGKERRLRLFDVMRLRGARPPDPSSSSARRDLRHAAAQCAECHYTKLCDELIECGAREGYSRFCPNAPYIEQVRCRSLRF